MPSKRALVRGIYVPTPTFFDPQTDELDLETCARHAVRLAKGGVAGLAVQGSNGEAVSLSSSERSQVTRATRQALDAAGFATMPLIVGCGAQSTTESLRLCRDAAADGGDYAMILPPNYYSPVFTGTTVADFFRAVADESPLPIIIYNYPLVTGGVDLNSDVLIELSTHANIVGCKFTCGNTGKMGRVAAAVAKSEGVEFQCFAGSTDFLLASYAMGSAGVIGGTANLFPRANVKLWRMAEEGGGKAGEARQLQAVLADADWAVAIKKGVPGTKDALRGLFGYGGHCRRPLPRGDEAQVNAVVEAVREMMEVENALPDVK